MDDLYASLVVITITGIVVVGIFWYSHRNQKKRSEALKDMVDRHGWGYKPISEPLSWGTKITGKNWILTAKSESIGQSSDSGSSNIQNSTVWTSEWSTPAKITLLIGPRFSGGIAFQGLFTTPETTGLHEVDPGMAELSSRYLFLGNGQADLGFLRESSIPRLLMEWPDKIRPIIEVNPQALKISINGYRIDRPEEMEGLILLGEAFISEIG